MAFIQCLFNNRMGMECTDNICRGLCFGHSNDGKGYRQKMITIKIHKVNLKELKYPYSENDVSVLAILAYPIYLLLVFFIALILVPLVSITIRWR